MVERSSEYIRFELLEKKPRTEVWSVVSMTSNDPLGVIKWHGPWRQYIFEPGPLTIWSVGCLKSVQDFIEELMQKREPLIIDEACMPSRRK